MKKGENGTWETTVGPVGAGAYRYNFNVDGVPVIDPKNPATSESNNNTSSLVYGDLSRAVRVQSVQASPTTIPRAWVYVPGSEISDVKDVPHGAVASVTSQSQTLKRPRRMHVYTPPGYEKGEGKYPVFYLKF